MSLFVKSSGQWKQVKELRVKQAGGWVPVQIGYVKKDGTWALFYASSVTATISAGAQNLNISSLFSAEDWAATWKKKVVNIAAGVVIGSTNPAVAALQTGTGRGGPLEINISGEVQGAGGAANSGNGGPAINLQESNVTINVMSGGAIRGGGGGGGHGGQGGTGGAGYYVTSTPAQDGPYYDNNVYSAILNDVVNQWYWAGSRIYLGSGNPGSVSSGGYTYRPGSPSGYYYYNGDGSRIDVYSIYRTYTVNSNVYTSGGAGGAGGNGGIGQGYGQSASSGGAGSGGASGGTNAGAGGTGGTGGTGGGWAQSGSTGSTGSIGASGNNGSGHSGSSGSAGGAAGAAVMGQHATINNSGTINGAVS